MTRKIAIVGSGPSGCYLAQALRKQVSDAEIVLIDRLPVPYGLIRYGVASDHQGTKAVTEQFDRLFTRERVKFLGNVDVGVDIRLEDLQNAFDAVVLAVGVESDRRLDIPGEDHPRAYGAGRVTRILNGHPDEVRDGLELGDRVTIVGNGNVAIDIVRLLIKEEHDFGGSDIDDTYRNDLVKSLREVNVVGRGSAHDVRFDKTLIKELSRVSGTSYRLHGHIESPITIDSTQQSRIEDLRHLETVGRGSLSRISVNFYFGWIPESIKEGDGEALIRFFSSDSDGAQLTIATDSVITAIGFTAGDGDRFARDSLVTSSGDIGQGRLSKGLYATGWFRHGARGTIPEQRTASKILATTIVADVESSPVDASRKGLEALSPNLRAGVTDYEGWRSIDALERAAATENRYRRKIITREGLLAASASARTKAPGKLPD